MHVSVASTLNEPRAFQIQCDTAKCDEEEEEKGFLLLTPRSAIHKCNIRLLSQPSFPALVFGVSQTSVIDT